MGIEAFLIAASCVPDHSAQSLSARSKEFQMSSDVMAHERPDGTRVSGFSLWRIVAPRQKPGFGALEGIIFTVYTALVGWAVAHHIPWADEAQAWLIARDASLREIFTTDLHYEGSPGLWHFFLWILCRMHVSYTAMHWISAVIPVIGIFVFLRFSPFPAILRITLPFSFYLLYQYAAIARSYVAVPLLIFVIAILFSRPARNLVSLAVVLGLLANLCPQGCCISLGFAAMLAVRLWRNRRHDAALTAQRLAAAGAVLGALWAIAALTASPTRDNRFMPDWDPVYMQQHRAERQEAVAASRTLAADSDASHFRGYNRLKRYESRFTGAITMGLSNSWLVSLIFVCVLVAFLWSRGNLVDIAPYILLQVLFSYVAGHAWHLGNLFLAVLGILWVGWPGREESNDAAWRSDEAWRAILSAIVLVVVIEQCFWSVRALRQEATGKYSGDRDAAEFLAGHIAGKTVAGFGYHCVGVLPYFPSNIFANQSREAFWHWKNKDYVDDHVEQALAKHPDFIDVGFDVKPHLGRSSAAEDPHRIETYRPDPEVEILATGQYRETHRFCGIAFSGHGYDEGECQAILEPAVR